MSRLAPERGMNSAVAQPAVIAGAPHNSYAVTNKCYVYPGLAQKFDLVTGSYLCISKADVHTIMQVEYVALTT